MTDDEMQRIAELEEQNATLRKAFEDADMLYRELRSQLAAAAPAKRHAPLLDELLAAAERDGVTRLPIPAWDDEPVAAAAPGAENLTDAQLEDFALKFGYVYDDDETQCHFSLSGLRELIAAVAAAAPRAEKMVPVEAVKELCRDYSSRTGSVYIKDVESSLDALAEQPLR